MGDVVTLQVGGQDSPMGLGEPLGVPYRFERLDDGAMRAQLGELDDEDDEDEALPALGPLVFVGTEPMRMFMAKQKGHAKYMATSTLANRFDGTLVVSVERALLALVQAGLVRRHTYRQTDRDQVRWSLSAEGRAAAWWAGPPLGAMDPHGYAREMVRAVAERYGCSVHDVLREQTGPPSSPGVASPLRW